MYKYLSQYHVYNMFIDAFNCSDQLIKFAFIFWPYNRWILMVIAKQLVTDWCLIDAIIIDKCNPIITLQTDCITNINHF